MISDFGLWLRRLVVRWSGYALGVIFVLAVLGTGALVFARPSLLSFVDSEVRKYGVAVESLDISLLGRINLKDARIPVRDGSVLTVGRLSVRPPVLWLGGKADLYDVLFRKGNMTFVIPELHVRGLSLAAKDPTVSSRGMQLLMRVTASRVEADEIVLAVDKDGSSKKATLHQLTLSGVGGGKIRKTTLAGFESVSTAVSSSATAVTINSGLLTAGNVDIASLHSFMQGTAHEGGTNGRVVGPVALHDLRIDLADAKGGKRHVTVGKLDSSGLSHRPGKVRTLETVRTFVDIFRSDDVAPERKQEALQGLLRVLESVTEADAEIKDVAVETPEFSTAFSSFELKPLDWNRIIPQGFIISLHDFRLDMTRLHNDYVHILRGMGYERVDMSLTGDMLWNPADRSMNLRNVVLSGRNIGELAFRGRLQNLDEEFFSGDPDRMLAALDGSAVSELDLTLMDSGIIDRFIAWETTQIHVSKQELKDSLYEIAVRSPPLLLKNHQDSQRISDAFGAFVRDSGTLHIHMLARETQGISLADFSMAENHLSALLDRMQLTVTRLDHRPSGAAGMR